MQLSRAIQHPPLVTPSGVEFCLEGNSQKVYCAVTRAALIFLAGHFLVEKDYGRIFSAYRDQIAHAAARKFAEESDSRSRVIVNAHDLVAYAPDLHQLDETPTASR
jgi:Protein of unknown function (DUF1488)